MRAILRTTRNVKDLFLSLQINSSDSSSGLINGLPLIDPTRLIIFDDSLYPLRNKAVLNLVQALEICVPNWKNLNTINFSYKYAFGRGAFCSKFVPPRLLKQYHSHPFKSVSFPTS
ncbi:hypothetical protein FB451DRAFT_272691 [Mycena latifolia]|nr:hypothetical protein FB451DRAFT_272691 [Mycena latifolia]